MQSIFDKSEPNAREQQSDNILKAIENASALGQEAAEEPRYWRNPWQEEAFNLAIRSAHFIRVCLTAVECSVAAGGKKNKLFMEMLRLPSGSFGRVSGLTIEKVALLQKLLVLF